MSECKHKFISTNRIFCTHCEFEPSDDYVLLLKQLKEAQADIQTQKANLLSQGRLLVEAREEVSRLREFARIQVEKQFHGNFELKYAIYCRDVEIGNQLN